MKMGSGMTVFLSEEVKTMEEWDEVSYRINHECSGLYSNESINSNCTKY